MALELNRGIVSLSVFLKNIEYSWQKLSSNQDLLFSVELQLRKTLKYQDFG